MAFRGMATAAMILCSASLSAESLNGTNASTPSPKASTTPVAPASPVKSKPVISGTAPWAYQSVPGWGMSKLGQFPGPTHGGVAIGHDGLIYASTDNEKGILVFKPDGELVRSIAPDCRGCHALILREEGGREYLYAAHLLGNRIVKLTTDGAIVWTLTAPPESGLYPAKPFNPTSVAVAPDGSLFVADGYGASVIHRYSPELKYLGTITEAGGVKLSCPHGILIDTRTITPTLLVCDRVNRRIIRLGLDGSYIGLVASGLHLPSTMAIYGDTTAVTELEGRVDLLNQKGDIISTLGENLNKNEQANYGVPPDAWHEGIFTAPHGICFDANGNLFVTDWNRWGRISRLDRLNP
jgi:outer membrane protein assembly factor BamB